MSARTSKKANPNTVAIGFMPSASTGAPMFELRAGLPLAEVLNQASVLMGSIAALSHQCAENIEHGTPDAALLYAQADLIEMADACILSVLAALSGGGEVSGKKGGAA